MSEARSSTRKSASGGVGKIVKILVVIDTPKTTKLRLREYKHPAGRVLGTHVLVDLDEF